ncbi:ectoine synthase [Paracoccus sp. (in: a-proteobacteria)]|uniref:ectoine synthase n=1 Tax=Paracoccus sp. TaxID=267 RepID=UPI003A85A0D2
MIIRTLDEIEGTERDVSWGNGKSRRFLIERDGMGYSMTDTQIAPNTCSVLEYRNHLETCYCVEGSGKVVDESTGAEHEITAGTMYALDRHDRHQLIGGENGMRLVCMFTPALRGDEVHDLNGDASSSY